MTTRDLPTAVFDMALRYSDARADYIRAIRALDFRELERAERRCTRRARALRRLIDALAYRPR